MAKKDIALFICGSFNPVTNLHLRMMEISKDHLQDLGYTVSQGIVSPVHDGYKKEGLLPVSHRSAMLKLALASTEWIQLSTWESEQTEWSKTYDVLRYQKSRLNGFTNDGNMNSLPDDSNDLNGNPDRSDVNVMMVCGGDTLASFSVPNVWNPSDIEGILTEHGLVVITRSGYDIENIIYENDILFKNRKHIFVVKEYIENTVSSSKVRRACSRGHSIKYLVPDAVERYIKTHGLYSMSSKYGQKATSIAIPANLVNDSEKGSTNNKRIRITSSKNEPTNKPNKKKKM